jgi:hypothetical protein
MGNLASNAMKTLDKRPAELKEKMRIIFFVGEKIILCC